MNDLRLIYRMTMFKMTFFICRQNKRYFDEKLSQKKIVDVYFAYPHFLVNHV